MAENPEDLEEIGKQLREKIRSKFQSSTVLAGFTFTLLGLQITRLLEPSEVPTLLFLSIPLMVIAAELYVCAIIWLDGLTMPKYFWEKPEKELDSPRSSEANKNPLERARSLLTRFWDPDDTAEVPDIPPRLEPTDLRHLKSRMLFYWNRLVLLATGFLALSLLLLLFPLQPINTTLGTWPYFWLQLGTFLLVLAAFLGTTFAYCRRTYAKAEERWPLTPG